MTLKCDGHCNDCEFLDIHHLLNNEGWQHFEEDRLGNDLFISDPDRADRIHKAAKDGCDGSTHAEHIDDWRDYVKLLRQDDDICDACEERLTEEIDAVEEFHEKAGTLLDEIG